MALSMALAVPGCAMAEESTEAATETVSEAAETETEEATEVETDVKGEGVMTHEEYLAADVDAEVVIETYVQAKQSWWTALTSFTICPAPRKSTRNSFREPRSK